MSIPLRAFAFSILLLILPYGALGQSEAIDLTQAAVVSSHFLDGPERKAVEMLVEEVGKRTGIVWPIVESAPNSQSPSITIDLSGNLRSSNTEIEKRLREPYSTSQEEGFHLWIENTNPPQVKVGGNDARGVLFGVGKLLRSMSMSRGKVTITADLSISTTPEYSIRGHQLGYRPKANSYDGWTLEMWEQYIRDLAVFGTNAVELIPPISDDADDSPHFPLPKMETMIGMSSICDAYGMDVWIWYPALEEDYAKPETVEKALREWGEVFEKLPRIDAVFVPCGDPGHTPPEILMPMLEKQAVSLRKHHPEAELWVGPQGFSTDQLNTFLAILNQKPAWLTGVVYGPWSRLPIDEFRKAVPSQYPIRHYPDITHTLQCQYPIPDWDLAFALTAGREPINPRPMDQAQIFRVQQPHTVGAITYSEGCHDDVNKIIWSVLGWNSKTPVVDILREYCRYFIGAEYGDAFAQGLLALERNWQGPAPTHRNIPTTLQQFQEMERDASPTLRLNWRYQMALFRAYYDAYVQNRLIQEEAQEAEAMSILQDAERIGSETAISRVENALRLSPKKETSDSLRSRVFEWGEALFQSIHLQLDTPRYKAGRPEAAMLDRIDAPLNNRIWLLQQLQAVRQLESEKERLARLEEIVNWTDPGPGGFYDNLGDPKNQPHLVTGPGFEKDPSFLRGSVINFLQWNNVQGPRSWWDNALVLYDQPLIMQYDDLDPSAKYKLRVIYPGGPLSLTADDRYEVHSLLNKPNERLEFDIPTQATSDGELLLTWRKATGEGRAGRGNQVAEVWLMMRK